MKTIEAKGRGAIDEVIALAYEYLQDMRLYTGGGFVHKGPPEAIAQHIGNKSLCLEASDAVTRAAHELGIAASREGHGQRLPDRSFEIGHYLTSFAPVDEAPRETDPIVCLTWGQFDQVKFKDYGTAYFGPRVGIHELVGLSSYRTGYTAGSIALRQVTHTRAHHPSIGDLWLKTTPEDIESRVFPVGVVEPGAFPEDMWQHPDRLPRRR
jgi:hypothetical protein